MSKSHSSKISSGDNSNEPSEKEEASKSALLSQQEIDSKFKKISEGKAQAYFHQTKNDVFYNPVQEFNRDLSIAVLNTYSTLNGSTKQLNILEALAASGIRSMRYAREIDNCKHVVANDFDASAVELIKLNIDLNNVQHKVSANCDDATVLMNKRSRTNFKNLAKSEQFQFDCIDLDPYGSPAPFLDAALRTISNDGILLVTATDAGVLCGNGADTCYTKYGALSHRTPCCHELALRILLQTINSHAIRYSRYIVPLISLSIDFYFRLFVIVKDGQMKAKESIQNIGFSHICNGCHSFYIQKFGQSVPTSGNVKFVPGYFPSLKSTRCTNCNTGLRVAGPIWLGKLHDKEFVSNVLKHVETREYATYQRINGMLNLVLEELDDPLYYVLDELSSVMHCQTPNHSAFRSALLNANYQVSYSHCNKNSFKTNAPNEVIWNIFKEWIKQTPIKEKWLTPDHKVYHILNKDKQDSTSVNESKEEGQEENVKYDFTIREDSKPVSKKNKLLRYHEPPPFWGPKARPKKRTGSANETDDSIETINESKKAQKESK